MKMSAMMKSRSLSDETRTKMSIAAKARAKRDGRIGVGLFKNGKAM